MSCDPYRDELILLLDPELAEDPARELSPQDLAAIQGHAQACTSCQDELIRLTLALAAASEVPVPAPAAAASAAPLSSAPPSPAPRPLPPRPAGRYQRSARAAALARELPELRSRATGEDLPGRLGRYEVLEELGRGGMGVVYRARDPQGREVALKVCLGLSERLRTRRQRHTDELRRLLPDARASRLAGSRLAGPLDAFTVGPDGVSGELEPFGRDSLYVEVLPLLSGPSLEDLLREGRCDPREATEIAVEVARAMREAHELGLLLSDLKPSDVFLEAEGVRVLVPERPFQTNEHQLTCTGAMIGTPWYMSPEQLCGRRPDERSDLFSLGAIYHQLLTGAPPQKGAQNLAELVHARVEGDLPEPTLPELSPDHKLVLGRLLAASPEQRYLDAEELLGDLLRVSEDIPLEREAAPWKKVVRRQEPAAERASAIKLLGLVAALAALIALAYALLG